MNFVTPIKYEAGKLLLLDQRRLPHVEVYIECSTVEDAHEAIRNMTVRGAPLIGFTGIFALALWLKNHEYDAVAFQRVCDYLISARPTAVNLQFEVLCVRDHLLNLSDTSFAHEAVVKLANEALTSSEKRHARIASFAYDEISSHFGSRKINVLTHCNTGHLACGSLGTALGVIEYLFEKQLINKVWVDETRPYLQGSRLTSYELSKNKIPHQIVVEGAASFLMNSGEVDAIFVGADRIARNGDTANKVGTSNLAIISKHYKIPMYVVAPLSSFDLKLESGNDIEVEMRGQEEILELKSGMINSEYASAFNPSFDISKGEHLAGIICEEGVLKPPFSKSLGSL